MVASNLFPLDGGCDCGLVRYRMKTQPLFVHCCHCRWCQRESGSSFAWGANASHTMMVRYCLNNTVNTNEVLWMQTKRWNTAAGPSEPPTPVGCPWIK